MRHLLFSLALLQAPIAAHATPAENFLISIPQSGSTLQISFTLPANALPYAQFFNADPVFSATVTGLGPGYNNIVFCASNCGAIDLIFQGNAGPDVTIAGPQLYTGSRFAPVLAGPATYNVTDMAGDPGTLTISTPAATPEPPTLLLLSTAGLLMAFSLRRRLAPGQ